jgi:CRISPR-associated exonuclease Cas4
MLDDAHYFTVTDLKQYATCRRVVFYERCLPGVRPSTYKMAAGREAHDEEEDRAPRRTLRQYGEHLTGERRFHLRLASPRLNLTGLLDEVVFLEDGTCFPVDYKAAKTARYAYKIQLAAYALLLEDSGQSSIATGYLYLIPLRKTVPVNLTAELRQAVLTMLDELHTLVAHERMPPPAATPQLCMACEFRRFCNDV